jgi:hypothetical protein
MANLTFVQACTTSALGLGVYQVVVTVVFSLFFLIGGALAIARASRGRLVDALYDVVMALVGWLFAALLLFSLFYSFGSPPTRESPAEITPLVLIPMIAIAGIALIITVVGAIRKLKAGDFPEIGVFEIGWVTGILVTLWVGILGLFARGPFALGKELPQSEETGGGEIAASPVPRFEGNPYIGLVGWNLIAIAVALTGLTMLIRNEGERRDGLIICLIGVGGLLLADVPAAAAIANGCPPALSTDS